MEHELKGLRSFEKNEKSINENPAKEANEAWPNQLKYNPEVKGRFSGPDDPKFIVFLREDYKRASDTSRALVRQLEESKP